MIDDQHMASLPSDSVHTESVDPAGKLPETDELPLEAGSGADHNVCVYRCSEAPTRYEHFEGQHAPPQNCELVYRLVRIPVPDKTGKLYVGHIPGRFKTFDEEFNALLGIGIGHIVSLVPEIDLAGYRIPDYYRVARERLGDNFHLVETVDYEVPDDDELWAETVEQVVTLLESGETVFVHCGAGCGRTGTFVSCLLTQTGMSAMDAIGRYATLRGCGPESEQQVDYVVRFKNQMDATGR